MVAAVPLAAATIAATIAAMIALLIAQPPFGPLRDAGRGAS
jgi:hypothetical protein